MAENSPKWPKMAQNGPKWPQNGPKWPKTDQYTENGKNYKVLKLTKISFQNARQKCLKSHYCENISEY